MAEPIKSSQVISDDHVDDHVDDEIRNCFMSEPPKSFFMFAGAGSGKTRSLINTLEFLSAERVNIWQTRANENCYYYIHQRCM